MKPIVVILAAGMGSRYGGLKQIDPVGPNDEIIIDYSIYDAVQAGFERFIFIIKEENQEAFDEVLTSHLPKDLEINFAYQKLDDLPENCEVPEGREKPWGTAHAVYAARDLIDAPFVVLNADDYYGPKAFEYMYDFLMDEQNGPGDHAMIGYHLRNTLTENGSVSRGVCSTEDGRLVKVTETKEIYADGDGGKYSKDGGETFNQLAGDTLVSMNFWGYQLDFLDAIERDLKIFFEESVPADPMKAEFFLPITVTNELQSGAGNVEVIPTSDKWMGVTYKEDKERVQEGFKDLVEKGTYPSPLW